MHLDKEENTMYKDCHVHTQISHDGISKMEEYLAFASKKGVDEITFTEHYDIYDGLKTNIKTLNVEDYFQYYTRLKQTTDFKFNFGIEIGLQPDISKTIKALVARYPFDFIIGSSHITCKKDMAMDNSFFYGLTRKEAYLNYFREVLTNIKLYDEFDVYGHLDYVVRYGGYHNKMISYTDFSDILDAILTELIKKDKGIEINTSGIRYGLPYPHPNIEIIRRYRDLGGKIITIGSDAHKVDDLAKDFDMVYDILDSLNITEYTVFHNRQPMFFNIKKLKN